MLPPFYALILRLCCLRIDAFDAMMKRHDMLVTYAMPRYAAMPMRMLRRGTRQPCLPARADAMRDADAAILRAAAFAAYYFRYAAAALLFILPPTLRC